MGITSRDDFDLILLGESGTNAEGSDDEDSSIDLLTCSGKATGKGDAAAWLARMEGTKTMAKKIAGAHEKEKFWNDVKTYEGIGGRDWSTMAEAWNLFVAEREKKKENDVVKYYRKHAHMLEAYMDLSGKSNNIKSTLQQHQRSIDSLTEEFREPVSGPLTSLDAPCPKATHGPSSDPLENTDFSNMVPLVPLHMSYATILTNQKSGPLVYPGQLQQSFETNDKKRQLDRDRAPQLCSTCGHYRQHNSIHNQKHVIKCAVREELYSIDRSVKGWCSCSECMEGAKNVGYSKPALVVKQMRALKTCTKCGHYKDYGYFSDLHSNSECNVLQEKYATHKYKGHCSCENCISTALLRGKEKNTKLRKLY
jgi:hypothetical protein